VKFGDQPLDPVWPVDANEVFVVLPRKIDERLKTAGATYYPWDSRALPKGLSVAGDAVLARLVTGFATTGADVDQFADIVRGR